MRKLENTGPVHERLYESNKKPSFKKQVNMFQATFTPKRTLKGEQTVFDRLI